MVQHRRLQTLLVDVGLPGAPGVLVGVRHVIAEANVLAAEDAPEGPVHHGRGGGHDGEREMSRA